MSTVNVEKLLPITAIKDSFLTALSHSSPQVILVTGPVGAGKSTQVPLWAISAGRVICAQPRRLGAVPLATHSALVMGSELGSEVGFAIRHEQKPGSKLTYCTDGFLLRSITEDPLLKDYSVVIVDEIQERRLYTDVLVAQLKKVLKSRPDLKVVLMGADLDLNKYSAYLNVPCTILTLPNPPLPTIEYRRMACLTPAEVAVETVVGLQKTEGDVLVFLATQEEVEKACEKIRILSSEFDVLPLHSGLTPDQVKPIYSPSLKKKCIVSTALGESCVVFGGVSHVIDTGFRQADIYEDGTDVVRRISKATADRRARRAMVKAIRIYSEETYEEMEEEDKPVVLTAESVRVEAVLKECGVEDTKGFDCMDKPTATTATSAAQ